MAHIKMLYSKCQCFMYYRLEDTDGFADSIGGGCSCDEFPLEDIYQKCEHERVCDVFRECDLKRFEAHENDKDGYTAYMDYPWVLEAGGKRYPCRYLEIDGNVMCDTR